MIRNAPSKITLTMTDVDRVKYRIAERSVATTHHAIGEHPRPHYPKPRLESRPRYNRGPERSRDDAIIEADPSLYPSEQSALECSDYTPSEPEEPSSSSDEGPPAIDSLIQSIDLDETFSVSQSLSRSFSQGQPAALTTTAHSTATISPPTVLAQSQEPLPTTPRIRLEGADTHSSLPCHLPVSSPTLKLGAGGAQDIDTCTRLNRTQPESYHQPRLTGENAMKRDDTTRQLLKGSVLDHPGPLFLPKQIPVDERRSSSHKVSRGLATKARRNSHIHSHRPLRSRESSMEKPKVQQRTSISSPNLQLTGRDRVRKKSTHSPRQTLQPKNGVARDGGPTRRSHARSDPFPVVDKNEAKYMKMLAEKTSPLGNLTRKFAEMCRSSENEKKEDEQKVLKRAAEDAAVKPSKPKPRYLWSDMNFKGYEPSKVRTDSSPSSESSKHGTPPTKKAGKRSSKPPKLSHEHRSASVGAPPESAYRPTHPEPKGDFIAREYPLKHVGQDCSHYSADRHVPLLHFAGQVHSHCSTNPSTSYPVSSYNSSRSSRPQSNRSYLTPLTGSLPSFDGPYPAIGGQRQFSAPTSALSVPDVHSAAFRKETTAKPSSYMVRPERDGETKPLVTSRAAYNAVRMEVLHPAAAVSWPEGTLMSSIDNPNAPLPPEPPNCPPHLRRRWAKADMYSNLLDSSKRSHGSQQPFSAHSQVPTGFSKAPTMQGSHIYLQHPPMSAPHLSPAIYHTVATSRGQVYLRHPSSASQLGTSHGVPLSSRSHPHLSQPSSEAHLRTPTFACESSNSPSHLRHRLSEMHLQYPAEDEVSIISASSSRRHLRHHSSDMRLLYVYEAPSSSRAMPYIHPSQRHESISRPSTVTSNNRQQPSRHSEPRTPSGSMASSSQQYIHHPPRSNRHSHRTPVYIGPPASLHSSSSRPSHYHQSDVQHQSQQLSHHHFILPSGTPSHISSIRRSRENQENSDEAAREMVLAETRQIATERMEREREGSVAGVVITGGMIVTPEREGRFARLAREEGL
ncbi:hypothetical protein K402DRAFT_256336 [Aulographum hederae CBS 113979]|uniref:Uncharacterized protein n=1 Tax=Aulographum hederae CBS 113979 TaxID=1176131 RepID=A0A6G1H8I9_9PEZI|nr:hypothetical protein K402DRAFT_256336 [Aulographum hederae CBS 113979]